MKQGSTKVGEASRAIWTHLEEWVREQVQRFIQMLLEEEVTELLGRRKSERRQPVEAPQGYRNGYGKPRKLTLRCGTITLRRPRLRGLQERFESRILPLFERRTREVAEALPQLYLHGLALGDFDLALRGLLGDDAPLSASTVARLKETWQAEYEAWRQQSLEGIDIVYLWVDGVYVKAGLEKEKAALLVALGALRDGRKIILAVTPGYRESTESWSAVLRDLKGRGMEAPKLVVGDGHLGIWGALANVYPEAAEQGCWNHKVVNALDKLPKKHHARATHFLRQIAYAPTCEEAEKAKATFQRWCQQHGFSAAAAVLDRHWERMVTFYRFPKAHWKHLRTSNPVESPFASVRLRTNAAKRFKKVDNATAVIWKMLLVAESRFRRLDAPQLLEQVFSGAKFVNGEPVKQQTGRKAA